MRLKLEYFLAGLNEGGASIDEYVMTLLLYDCPPAAASFSDDDVILRDGLVSGQVKHCSAVKICFRVRHCFFLPDADDPRIAEC